MNNKKINEFFLKDNLRHFAENLEVDSSKVNLNNLKKTLLYLADNLNIDNTRLSRIIHHPGVLAKAPLPQKAVEKTRVLSDRNEMLHHIRKGGIAVELGIDKGEFSEQILKIVQPEKYYLIDIWGDERFGEDKYQLVNSKFKHEIASGRIEILRGYSFEMLSSLPDESIDFIYIDTDHSYRTTKKELDIALCKVKNNGIIAGHDYSWGNVYSGARYGVIEAVNEFLAEHTDWYMKYLSCDSPPAYSFALEPKNIPEEYLQETTDTIHVFFCTDNDYLMPTIVCAASILVNAKPNDNIKFHVLGDGLDASCQKRFDGLQELHDFKLEIHDTNTPECQKLLAHYCNADSHVSRAALLKMMIPIFAKGVDKALYLDGDTIVIDSLSELWGIDLSDKYAAVVEDTGYYLSPRLFNTKKMQYPSEYRYFNSGMMLLNLKKIRKDNLPDKIEKIIKKYSLYTVFVDQDYFNKLFQGNVVYLPFRWNFFSNFRVADKLKNVFISEVDQISILHFSYRPKPWNSTEARFSELWLEYYAKTNYSALDLFRSYNQYNMETAIKSKKSPPGNIALLKKHSSEACKAFKRGIKKRLGLDRFTSSSRKGEIERKELSYGLNKYTREKSVIVSLTTYTPRLPYVHQVITSLLNQKMKPDQIILWLGDDVKNFLPGRLLELIPFGLTIKRCRDMRSYKKLIPTLELFPDDIIITCDDDIIYEPDTIEELYKAHIANPDEVICRRAHKMIFFKDGNMAAYWDWIWDTASSKASYFLFPTGACGVLYPPGTFHRNVLDVEKFLQLAPHADDLWFKVMSIMNRRKTRSLGTGTLTFVEGSQDESLQSYNVHGNQNDRQLKALLDYYQLWPRIEEMRSAEVADNLKNIPEFKCNSLVRPPKPGVI